MLTHSDVAFGEQSRHLWLLVDQLFEQVCSMLEPVRIAKVFHDTGRQVVRYDGSNLDLRVRAELPA